MLAQKLVLGGPGWFKTVWEAQRINFPLISCKIDLMVPSDDQTQFPGQTLCIGTRAARGVTGITAPRAQRHRGSRVGRVRVWEGSRG